MKIRTILMILAAAICCGNVSADDAQTAWTKLVGKKGAKSPAFSYVKNKPGLPNVLIYGDSISIAYTPDTRKALEGKANVYRLWCNGGDSSSVIGKIDKMQKVMRNKNLKGHWDFEWDVIHFNVGLHDLKYLNNGKLDKKNGKQVSSLETYEKNLRAIVAYFKKIAPKAKLIWCSTTPVPDGEPGRAAGDAAKYNAVAMKVMKDHPEIIINDLFTFTKPNQPKWWTRPGNVHFNTKGRELQGKEVARIIAKVMKK